MLKGDGLNEIAEVPLRLAGQQVDGVAEIETWLQTQVEPQFALRWRPSGGWRVPVRNTAQLTDCVSALPGLAAWGCWSGRAAPRGRRRCAWRAATSSK